MVSGSSLRILHINANLIYPCNAKKIRELISTLKKAGFYEISGSAKGSHRKFNHKGYSGAVTISGKLGDDAKPYQEKQVKQAIEEIKP